MHGWQAILCARVRCQFYEGFARNKKATGYAGGSLLAFFLKNKQCSIVFANTFANKLRFFDIIGGSVSMAFRTLEIS